MISIPVAGLIVSILGLITVFAVLGLLFVRVIRFLLKHKTIFGDTLPIRLIGVGITALLFSEGITALTLSPIQYIFGTVNNVLSEFQSLTVGAEESNLWNIMSSLAFRIVSDSYSAVYYYPIKQVLFAIAFWIIFGQFFSTYKTQGDNYSLFTSLPDYVRKNILRISVFCIGIYLSLAAIIAIPWLQEEPESENDMTYNSQALRQALVQAKKDSYDSLKIGDFPIEAPAAELRNSLSVVFATNSATKESPAFLDKIDQVIGEKLTLRAQLVNEWNQTKFKHDHDLDLKIKEIVSKFESEMGGLKTRERIKYFQQLREYYQMMISTWNDELIVLRRRIDDEDEYFRQGIMAVRQEISNVRTDEDAAMMDNIIQSSIPSLLYVGNIDNSVLNSSVGQLPSSPEPGEEWGIFSMLGSWLFRTDNMSLVLITGVIGFGLFGASISSFVRDFTSMKAGEGVKDFNVGEMIIRGISAAVVIFLAVEGGLSVFTQEKMNPNPHVLFFSCLVGAVFSEQIWNWAKDKLEDNFKTDDDEGSGAGGNGGNSEEPVNDNSGGETEGNGENVEDPEKKDEPK